MPLGKAQIFTLALRYLGMTRDAIENPDNVDDVDALLFSAWWDAYLPKELEMHDWQFARSAVLLAKSGTFTESPFPGLMYVYNWPSDCIMPRFIQPPTQAGRQNIPMRIGSQGEASSKKKLIYTSQDDATLVYTADVTRDEGLFSPSFSIMMAARLAYERAHTKYGRGKQLDGIERLYRGFIIEAKNSDLQTITEDDLDKMFTSSFVTARGEGIDSSPPQTFLAPTDPD